MHYKVRNSDRADFFETKMLQRAMQEYNVYIMQKIENLKPTKGESEHWVVRKNNICISMNILHR